jgi:hypothetical protein
MEADSVGEIITSIPFSNHYEYTASYNDFGHSEDNEHFWRQMDFLTPELLRILKPSRIYACHVKDRILFGNVTGAGLSTVSPFHAEAIFHGMKHGFDYCGMITVDTDVVTENNGNYRLGYTEMLKDGSKMRSSGNRLLTREEWLMIPPKAIPKAFRPIVVPRSMIMRRSSPSAKTCSPRITCRPNTWRWRPSLTRHGYGPMWCAYSRSTAASRAATSRSISARSSST